MKKILLNGVDGNFGGKSAGILLEKYPHEDLIFTAPREKALKKYKEMGIETRVADFNNAETLVETFKGADTVVLISMPFVGPKRRAAHKTAIDAAVRAGVKKLVYTSIVGAGEKDINTYEVNDHVWTENYIKEQPIHYLILRDSQYAEAMVSSFVEAYERTNGVLANNMGEGKMAFISRDDCATAAAYAAMSEDIDKVLNINGAELLTIADFLEIASEVTGKKVVYKYITDDAAKNFPFCSDGMVTFGKAIRQNQMSVYTNDFEKLTGRKPLFVRQIFEDFSNHLIGNRTSTDN